MARLTTFGESLEVEPAADDAGEAEPIAVRSVDEGVVLIRRFSASGLRPLRSLLSLMGRDASLLTDGDVTVQVARFLAFGRLRAYRSRETFTLPSAAIQLEKEASTSPAPSLTWIEIHLVDDDGHPVQNERYHLELADGTSQEGRLDANGRAFVNEIAAGQCKVTFPDLDRTEWKPAG